MSSKKFKSQASSARAASTAFGTSSFGAPSAFQTATSPLSYVTELPDLSTITEPNVVVAFKNLGKRDSITKAKALEELQEHLLHVADSGIESAILEAWINIYPRTSIDNSRTVRQLAHSLQGAYTAAAGKRIAPYLPKIVGPWLSGTFDSDKSASRAAQSALEKSFPTKEKQAAVWNLYRLSLIEYAEDAILNQSPQTLSDERTTSPDDAEAKHTRVVGTAMLVISQLLANSTAQQRVNSNLTPLLGAKQLWEFAYHSDPYVRRGVYSLVTALCDEVGPGTLDWELISTCLLAKSLHISQLGSTRQYCEALLAISKVHPSVWTNDYHGKTVASKRLFQYLKRGSQRGPETVWALICQLLQNIPAGVWYLEAAPSIDEAIKLLEALHDGVSNPDEPMPSASAAWTAYVNTFFWILDNLQVTRGDDPSDAKSWGPGSSAVDLLVEQQLAPIIYQYIEESGEKSQWRLPGPIALHVCSDCVLSLTNRKQFKAVEQIWTKLADHLVDAMRLSLPETSIEFRASQDAVITKGKRFTGLQASTKKTVSAPTGFQTGLLDNKLSDNPDACQSIADTNSRIVEAALVVFKTRNGKPYGAAGVLQLPSMVMLIPDDFFSNDFPKLLHSPSADRLISILLSSQSSPVFPKTLETTINIFLSDKNLCKSAAFHHLLQGLSSKDFAQNTDLERIVLDDLQLLLKGDSSDWDLVASVLENSTLGTQRNADPVASQDLQARLLGQMMDALSLETEQDAALRGFEVAIQRRSQMNLSALLSRLLVLSDSPRESTADLAAQLTPRVKSLAGSKGSDLATQSSSELIAEQLAGTGQPLSVLGLVELGETLVRDAPERAQTAFPSVEQWQNALEPFLKSSPPVISAIVSPLSGVVYAIDRAGAPTDLARDSDEFSLALRLTLYATKLLRSTNIVDLIEQIQISGLYLYYPQAVQLVNDKLTLDSSNNLWSASTTEVLEEMVELLSQGEMLIAEWIRDAVLKVSLNAPVSLSRSISLATCWLGQLDALSGVTTRAYHMGITFTSIMSECVDAGGVTHFAPNLFGDLDKIRTSDDLVRSTAVVAVARDFLATSPRGKKICNELVADVTDLRDMTRPIPALRPLVLLNTLLHGDAVLLDAIPTQRAVFLVKNLVTLLKSEETPYAIISEALKLLYHAVAPVSEIYGEHWEDIFDIISRLWDHENDLNGDLPALHSSLRLYGRLKLLAKAHPNEDLVEAFDNASPDLVAGLLSVLKLFEEPVLGTNQPRAITTELLKRQLADVKLPPTATAGLFPLIASDERSIQSAAFRLLHRAVPEAQQQNSLDVVLDKKTLHLPEELMSLLLHAPSMQTLARSPESREHLWMGVRRYLLSWNIVLDHFENASYKLRELYAVDIKEYGNLPSLLVFVCEISGMASGRPLDASKFDIKAYEVDGEDSLEQEARWLSVHLYYLCLLYLPSSTKEWFIEQKNRIKMPLESWTQKHFSHLLVSQSLETVSEWATTQETDDRPISIKTSPKGSELVASIAIDEESPPISLAISLPGAYPLEQAVVTSRNRVGVSEKNWQSWLRTFQVIIFSTGSLIEGLIAFRKNVQGALKGQNECAICYSIIGTDMQTPNRTCGTCNNTFHSTCLYRWFKSSNSSGCPLCRNNFNYA